MTKKKKKHKLKTLNRYVITGSNCKSQIIKKNEYGANYKLQM